MVVIYILAVDWWRRQRVETENQEMCISKRLKLHTAQIYKTTTKHILGNAHYITELALRCFEEREVEYVKR